jgi:hypothetical protein
MAKTLKDFLNERQLGPMVVKNPDEQKFIDKHVVAKTADRNGNDDEVFKGSKVKMADRKKERHGYNPGEDEEVYEELKGNQHKIDANKNGKVDAHDFHLLRKKKKVAEEADDPALKFKLHMAKKRQEMQKKGLLAKEEAEQIDELSTDTMKSYGDKRARTVFSGGRKPGQSVDAGIKMKSKQSNSLSLARTKINRARDTGSTVLSKEEAEQIDELSKATLGSYTKKAARSTAGLAANAAARAALHGKASEYDKRTLRNRLTGISKATDRMTKEEAEQIDELSKDTVQKYKKAAVKDFYDADDVDDGRRVGQRYKGIKMANRKLAKEEAEELEELSHDTLRRYRMKSKSIADNEGPLNYREKGRELAGRKTYGGRMAGIEKAKVMAKEEAEQIDELSIDTMKSYGDKRARTAFSGGRKPGQSVDAGIKTKSRQINSLALSKTKINRARDTGSTILNKEEAELQEKLDMKKASMGTVVKDFQKSDAPQFMGKSQKKRQVMAIAAKLSAERDGKPLNKEERLLTKLADISETHQRTMISVFEKLNEDNQYAFMQACDTADGIEQMLDFSISYRGE